MKEIMDGCTAATHVAFALSDVATIYPITPVAEMGQVAQKWGLEGRRNYAGAPLAVKEMESELGAAGATHGALAGGALATTFTNSQGLLLMIPNMYKIAGECLPAVFHIGTRSIASHALSIFGDHQDIMACRATGFAFLGSSNVQETMDLAVVAHLAAIEGSLPVVHFFDGWRTSGEMQTIDVIDYPTIFSLLDRKAVERFRAGALNPEHPSLRGSAQNSDVYFQNREACNRAYAAFPDIVQKAMDRVGAATGRRYRLFDYYGAADAERVVVVMGSGAEVARCTAEALAAAGEKVGVVNVRLFRPWSTDSFIAALPPTVSAIAVLDRTKEPGSQGEPLYQDVATSVLRSVRQIRVVGGRYGLSSKDFSPAMARAVFEELKKDAPRREFTVGITDDVTGLSLDVDTSFMLPHGATTECVFYGFGSDGTVGASKQIASIIGSQEGMYAQAFFSYSAKKSGGYTLSQLRFGQGPIAAAWQIESAELVFCNKAAYVNHYDMAGKLREGGTFVLNAPWSESELEVKLPASMRRELAAKKAKLYLVDATAVAASENLGSRINTVMEAVFFHLSGIIPEAVSMPALKALVSKTYMHEGGAVVQANLAAIDKAVAALREVAVPEAWATATDAPQKQAAATDVPEFVEKVARPCNDLRGDALPVSLFNPEGNLPMGTTAYEKRKIAIDIPQWDPSKCVQCTICSTVCSHAAIRPFVLDASEQATKPADIDTVPSKGLDGYYYRIQVYPADCTGCGSCATMCPGHALTMVPLYPEIEKEEPRQEWVVANVSEKPGLLPRFTVKGAQLHRPLLQFSGACGGCGETPYVKLLTQLFGERMIIANATGCSSIWGADYPSNAYCTLGDGRGPAWGNSLFEDNAEYGYGMAVAVRHRRERAKEMAEGLAGDAKADAATQSAAKAWLAAYDDPEASRTAGEALVKLAPEFEPFADVLGVKSVWAIGGDGWAYDIGFAGLDHVLASGENINILVMDTECYSNTGGQTSKATPFSAVTKYSPDGKRTYKKDMGRMMMTYPDVYVASVSLGANMQQTINALREAEAYPGPSLVIAYCPCINHGIRSGMSHSAVEQRNAVRCGYWPLYRYNPANAEPLTLDSATPDTTGFLPFINGEDRYADLKLVDPSEAPVLQSALEKRCVKIHELLALAASPAKQQ
ncbi:MAG: pyruvate:ferredoxin (flavodoxin) oxidoreductase [Muribaculaceae bacterium]|nr:pyruvate:ferredoxin (flavodoxin) oxidoreductase [Muribaculaceae bacterium]